MESSAPATGVRGFGLVGATLAALMGLLGSCSAERGIGDAWPRGAAIVADREALVRLFNQLERIGGTPLARLARERRRTLPHCASIGARDEDGDLSAALEHLACSTSADPLSALYAELAANDIVFALPVGSPGSAQLRGKAQIGQEGGIDLHLTLPEGSVSGPVSLLIPAGAAPGPALLSRRDELVHARIRPTSSLDIATLFPEGGQADRLFRLKSALFAGTMLKGSWEAAIYLPQQGHRVPRVAISLGVASRALAISAMEEFLGELRESWPIHRTPFSVGRAKGACLLDLRILPEFAPCYVATERALVVGWNPDSLRHALSGETFPDPGESSALIVELGRFGRADTLLAAAAGPADEVTGSGRPGPPDGGFAVPWSRIVASRVESRGTIDIEVTFEPGAGS